MFLCEVGITTETIGIVAICLIGLFLVKKGWQHVENMRPKFIPTTPEEYGVIAANALAAKSRIAPDNGQCGGCGKKVDEHEQNFCMHCGNCHLTDLQIAKFEAKASEARNPHPAH